MPAHPAPLLIDMCLSPDWSSFFAQHGIQSVHWSAGGDPRSEDVQVMDCARDNGYVVFTHELRVVVGIDAGPGPSVFQVRTQDVLPDAIGHRLLAALKKPQGELETGAIVTLPEQNSKVRILPPTGSGIAF